MSRPADRADPAKLYPGICNASVKADKPFRVSLSSRSFAMFTAIHCVVADYTSKKKGAGAMAGPPEELA